MVEAGVYLLTEEAAPPVARDLSDLITAIEGWAQGVADQIISAATDQAGLARVRISFDQAWRRVHRVDDRQDVVTTTSTPPPPALVASIVQASGAPVVAGGEGPSKEEPTSPPPPRREDEAARLARLRCEREEAKAADALDQFHCRLGQYVDACSWQAVVAQGFCAIRAQIERALPALVEAVRLAGDGRRAVLAAREWLNATRSKISRDAGKGVEK